MANMSLHDPSSAAQQRESPNMGLSSAETNTNAKADALANQQPRQAQQAQTQTQTQTQTQPQTQTQAQHAATLLKPSDANKPGPDLAEPAKPSVLRYDSSEGSTDVFVDAQS